MGRDPVNTMFNIGVNIVPNFMIRKTALYSFSAKSVENINNDKLKQCIKCKKWMNWKDSFINFLRTHTGINGVPVNYVIFDHA